MLKQAAGFTFPRTWRASKDVFILGFIIILIILALIHGRDLYLPASMTMPTFTTPPPTLDASNSTGSPILDTPANQTATTTTPDKVAIPIPPEKPIPSSIWQIILPKRLNTPEPFLIAPEALPDTATWLAKNPGYQYKLVGLDWQEQFLAEYYADQPQITRLLHEMSSPGQRSDLLRYLILYTLGGTYTDIDTAALQSIEQWVPAGLRHLVKVVVGIEFDKLDGPNWADIPHDLSFCQWTIAAAPGHPLLKDMATRVVNSLDWLSEVYNMSIPELKPNSFEVMNSTGPAAWTEVVMSHLQAADPTITTWQSLSGMTGPRLVGDILVLHIDGFGMGQPHSKSTADGTIPPDAFVMHKFHGSWRGEKRSRVMKRTRLEEFKHWFF